MTRPRGALLFQLARAAGGFIADWRDLVFLHYSVPEEALAPHVPLPLDTIGGRAFVSLVSFELQRLRAADVKPASLGRLLMRPFSNHQFLNLRTYVRGPAGPGILFVAEWINNRWSARVGPPSYGLPYRLAEMSRERMKGAGLRRILVSDAETGTSACLVVPIAGDAAARTSGEGSTDMFLLERYRAYTHANGRCRAFEIKHAPWQAAPFTLARTNTTLFESLYPWFKYATCVGGHFAAGFEDVVMGPPCEFSARPATASAPVGRAAEADGLPVRTRC